MSSTATGTSASTPGSADDAVLVPERSTTAAAALTMPASSRPTTPSGRWRREVSRGRSRSAGTVSTLTAHRAARPPRSWALTSGSTPPGVGRGPSGTPRAGYAVPRPEGDDRHGTARPALRPPPFGRVPGPGLRAGRAAARRLPGVAHAAGRGADGPAGHRALPVPAAHRAAGQDRGGARGGLRPAHAAAAAGGAGPAGRRGALVGAAALGRPALARPRRHPRGGAPARHARAGLRWRLRRRRLRPRVRRWLRPGVRRWVRPGVRRRLRTRLRRAQLRQHRGRQPARHGRRPGYRHGGGPRPVLHPPRLRWGVFGGGPGGLPP